jgi:hypothetical protein
MTTVYHISPGTQITLDGQDLQINGRDEYGYRAVDLKSGTAGHVPFGKFLRAVKDGSIAIGGSFDTATVGLAERLGGHFMLETLPHAQQQKAQLKLRICQAIEKERNMQRYEKGKPNLKLRLKDYEHPDIRVSIRDEVQRNLDVYIEVDKIEGSRNVALDGARNLFDMMKIYDALDKDEDRGLALAPADHLRGNRRPRISWDVRELMHSMIEMHVTDLKNPGYVSAHKALKDFIRLENIVRRANEIPELTVPSVSTVRDFHHEMLTPTQHLIATGGKRYAKNNREPGKSDIRALFIGEQIEIDECKISLISRFKVAGKWAGMSAEQKRAVKEADKEIQGRLTLLVAIDVATRMPLGWIITDSPSAEATMELLRMVTRDKTREARKAGCQCVPVDSTGVGLIKNDNGAGLRNGRVKTMLLGLRATVTDVRTYSPIDKPIVERLFGTLENFLKSFPGYTGNKPGALPGYDAMKHGVLDLAQLEKELTLYFVDEYPHEPHFGIGMGGRTPWEVYQSIKDRRGHFTPLDPARRLVALGWKSIVTPSDDGVRVLGLFFNSRELQEERDKFKMHRRKVEVYLDPSNISSALVIVPGNPGPIFVENSCTAVHDMTAREYCDLLTDYRRRNPDTRLIEEERLAWLRTERRKRIAEIEKEHGLRRSWSTQEELEMETKKIFAGAEIHPMKSVGLTLAPGSIADLSLSGSMMELSGPTTVDSVIPETASTPSSRQRKKRITSRTHSEDSEVHFTPSRLKQDPST